jgi:F-type H+-transporting ATPase subunit b
VQIDWFTVMAEIVNFLILIWLLKYFLYDRILNLADEREAKIASRFEEAEEKAREAEQKAESYRARQQALEEEQERLISEAKEEAEARRKEMLKKARQEVEETRTEWQQMLHQKQESFLQELRRRAGRQTVTLTRQALADLADAEMEQQMVEQFIKQLRNVAEPERQEIADLIQAADQKLVITTTYELAPSDRQTLLEVVHNQFGNETEGVFETSSDLICGIELKVNGHKIAWSLDHYLTGVEEDFVRVLEDEVSQKRSIKAGEDQ